MDFNKYKNTVKYSKANRQAWADENARLEAIFWKDAFEEAGVDFYAPHADLARSLAWGHGHSAGLQEVWNYFQDFADFLRPLNPDSTTGMNRTRANKILSDMVTEFTSKTKVERDGNAESIFHDDLQQYRNLTGHVREANFVLAWRTLQNMDTSCRDQVPVEVYYWIRNLARQGGAK